MKCDVQPFGNRFIVRFQLSPKLPWMSLCNNINATIIYAERKDADAKVRRILDFNEMLESIIPEN